VFPCSNARNPCYLYCVPVLLSSWLGLFRATRDTRRASARTALHAAPAEATMWNPEILRYKTSVMQRIQLAASHGYGRYVSGECRNQRIIALATKFAQQYSVAANENQRRWAKQNGRANALLFLYPKRESTDWLWWLLVSAGSGAVVKSERLRAVTGQRTRLSWLTEFESVLHQRSDSPRPSVTWRMKRQNYDAWHARIRSAVRARKTDLPAKAALASLYRNPGFAGIRQQVFRLTQLFRKEWIRSRRAADAMPQTRLLAYVQCSSCPTMPLEEIVLRVAAGRSAFPRAPSKHENSIGDAGGAGPT